MAKNTGITRTYRNRIRTSNVSPASPVSAIQTFRDCRQTKGTAGIPYKSLPAAKKIIPAPYAFRLETANNGDAYFSTITSGPSYYGYIIESGPCGTGLSGESLKDSSLAEYTRYKAKARLLDRMKGEGANIANMIGERKQVIGTVNRAVLTIYNTVKDLRHGRIASAVRRMGGDPKTARPLRKKDIADQWLSLQYGWKPLLTDVYDTVTGAHKREKNFPKVLRASASASSERPHPSQITGVGWSTSSKRTSRYVSKYTILAFPDAVLAEPAAIGITNPLTVLWEVTPWSFVVDWFYPVGNYLDQLSADHGWIFSSGCLTTFEKCTGYDGGGFSKTTQSGPNRTVETQYYYRSAELVEMSRMSLSGFPSPDRPKFKNPISPIHVQNSIALLTQIFVGLAEKKKR